MDVCMLSFPLACCAVDLVIHRRTGGIDIWSTCGSLTQPRAYLLSHSHCLQCAFFNTTQLQNTRSLATLKLILRSALGRGNRFDFGRCNWCVETADRQLLST